MRRLGDDEYRPHSNLLRLTSNQRLFVQRWVELFDRDAIRSLRCRPFWPDKVRQELTQAHTQYHSTIIAEELAALEASDTKSLLDFNFHDVDTNPLAIAESLAISTCEAGFHQAFLYHAHKPMLYPLERPFVERLNTLRTWWVENRKKRPMRVSFRVTRLGRHPIDASCRLVPWQQLAQPARNMALEGTVWEQYLNHPGHYVFVVNVSAADPMAAAEEALAQYSAYRASVKGGAANARPVEVDQKLAIIEDELQKPDPKTYCFSLTEPQLRIRGSYDAEFAEALTAASLDRTIEKISLHYSKALDDIRNGRPKDGLDDLAKALDLAYKDCGGNPYTSFVENSAILMTLEFPHRYFSYFLEYVLKPSFSIKGKMLFGEERRPERIFNAVVNDNNWEGVAAKCEWDELLKFRRADILALRTYLPAALKKHYASLRWDLARAVRARHSLFHRGETVQDAYLIAAYLEAFEIVLELRVRAHQHKISFVKTLQVAKQDYEKLVSGAAGVGFRSLACFGWWGARGAPAVTYHRAIAGTPT